MVADPGLKGGPIYLDYNATTPVDPEVAAAMLPYLTTYFGNPSSSHYYARATREAVGKARGQVADLLGCVPEEVVFTGCGSESDTLAIHGVVLASGVRGKHIITQVTEHPAVLNACRALERLHGCRVTYLPVDGSGRVNPADVAAAIDEQTVLVSIMQANNETGTLQPIAEIAEIAHKHGVLLHADASQAVGKIPTRVSDLDIDLLTVAGHKLYAPKGIGALYVRQGVALEPVIYGGGQEAGRRAGTENIALIVGLGEAAAIASAQLPESQVRLQRLRDQLHEELEKSLPVALYLNGHMSQRLPNTLNVSVAGLVGEEILAETPGIASSTGSACHEGNTEPSEVLLAMGIARQQALGALRLTLGRWTSEAEVRKAVILLTETVDSILQKRYNKV